MNKELLGETLQRIFSQIFPSTNKLRKLKTTIFVLPPIVVHLEVQDGGKSNKKMN